MWEKGHSFTEIDQMSVSDIAAVIGVWSGRAKGESRNQKRKQSQRRK